MWLLSRWLSLSFCYVSSLSTTLPHAFIQENEDSQPSHPSSPEIFSFDPFSRSRQLTTTAEDLEYRYIANVTTLAGVAGVSGSTDGVGTNSEFFEPVGIAISPDGMYALVSDFGNHLIRRIVISTASVTTLAGMVEASGYLDGLAVTSQFSDPFGISISPSGTYALVADRGNLLIRKINISASFVTTLAGEAGMSSSINGIGSPSHQMGYMHWWRSGRVT